MEKTRDEQIKEILNLFILAFLIVIIIFPIGILIGKAFQNNSGEYIGFKNFYDYFTNKNMIVSLYTFYFNCFKCDFNSSGISLCLWNTENNNKI